MKKLILSLFIACCIYASAQIPTNGLVGYYAFTGNAGDSSGNGNHGTVYRARLTKDRFGNSNCAYHFNYPDSNNSNYAYIEIPTNNLVNMKYTYSLWANPSIMPDLGTLGFAFDIGSAGGDQSINLQNYYLNSTGWGGGGYNTTSPHYPLQQRTNPSTGKWYHLLTIRDSNFMLLYIDGVLTDSISTGGNQSPYYGSGTVMAYIGLRNSGISHFDGDIDDILLYNRPLTKSEIASLYDAPDLDAEKLTKNNGISIYPNPAGNSLNIKFRDMQSDKQSTLHIYNALGQEVLTQIITQSSTTIDLTSISAKGLYIVSITDEKNNVIFNNKLLLE